MTAREVIERKIILKKQIVELLCEEINSLEETLRAERIGANA